MKMRIFILNTASTLVPTSQRCGGALCSVLKVKPCADVWTDYRFITVHGFSPRKINI